MVGDMQMLDLNIWRISKQISNSDGRMRLIRFKDGQLYLAVLSWYGYEGDPKYWVLEYINGGVVV